jgi:lipopolysaccharide biosynthesis regulator YciM
LIEEERAKRHAEICICGAKNLHEYIEYHFRDLDEPSRRKYERVMRTCRPEDHVRYGKWFLEMMGEPTEAELRRARDIFEKRKNDISEIYDGLYSAYQEMGLRNEAMELVLQGLKEFPDVPHLYELLGRAFFERKWVNEAKEILEQGLRKFPSDEGIKELLQEVEDDLDDPQGGEKLPIFGLILLMTLIRRKLRRKS